MYKVGDHAEPEGVARQEGLRTRFYRGPIDRAMERATGGRESEGEMSVYAALDTDLDGGEQVGTNTGWGDFGRWVDGLDAGDYGQVVHLREHGWSQKLADLESQLADALSESPPDDQDTQMWRIRCLASPRGAALRRS